MSTNGMISLVKGGKVIIKIIAGCDGYNAEKTAIEIMKYLQIDGDEIYLSDLFEICKLKKFGCDDCLTIMNESKSLSRAQSVEPKEYRETFEDPQFNPRNKNGSVEYLFIIPVEEKS